MMIESGAVSKSFPVFLPGARRRRVFLGGGLAPDVQSTLALNYLSFLCVCVEERMSIFVYK